jgi:hypothetical protein
MEFVGHSNAEIAAFCTHIAPAAARESVSIPESNFLNRSNPPALSQVPDASRCWRRPDAAQTREKTPRLPTWERIRGWRPCTGWLAPVTASRTLTGVGTAFTAQVAPGDGLRMGGNLVCKVTSIESDTSLTLANLVTVGAAPEGGGGAAAAVGRSAGVGFERMRTQEPEELGIACCRILDGVPSSVW